MTKWKKITGIMLCAIVIVAVCIVQNRMNSTVTMKQLIGTEAKNFLKFKYTLMVSARRLQINWQLRICLKRYHQYN